MTTRAAIYVRQSLDRSGEALAVTRQEQECREVADAHGWEVVEVYTDNDASATSGKPRPEWRRLLKDLEAGHYDVLIAWHTDRLYRRLRDLVDLLEVAGQRRLRIATVKASDLDLSTPAGRMVAGLLGQVASYETEQKGVRQVAANRQRAQAGVVLWTRRPYGFDRDASKVRVVKSEAKEIRRMAAALLDGRTATSIARDLNAREVVTSTGADWTVTSVKRVLTNPRLVGRVVYRGEDYGNGGLRILDDDTFARVGAILRDPARKTAPPSTEVKWLLSGLVRCGREGCEDAPMFASPNPQGRMIYRCRKCYGGRGLEDVDTVVMATVVGRLVQPDASAAFAKGEDLDTLRAHAEDLRKRRDGLASMLGEGLLSAEAVREQALKLAPEIDAAERAVAQATGTDPLLQILAAKDREAALRALTIKGRRRIIDTLATVRILPVGKGVRFAPEHVEITWH